MLNTLRAYSSWESAVELPLEPLGRAETDLLQIRNIDGLGPVTAAINTSPIGSMDGDTFVGTAVGGRNIVLTIKPNPNWADWTYEKLRQLLYTYFMPKRLVRLVFETDEIPPVEIFGYVESNEPQIFSKDGEIQVSIICPYPYFTSVDPVIIDGLSSGAPAEVENGGSIETGFQLQVSYVSGTAPGYFEIEIGSINQTSLFRLLTNVDADNYARMSSVAGQKYAQSIEVDSGLITNVLPWIHPVSIWQTLQPGVNIVDVFTDTGVLDWTMTFYNRYGGL